MKIYRSCIAVLFLLAGAGLSGQNLSLSGSGKGYENADLSFFYQSDPVTKRLKPVLSVKCNDKGSFTCDIPCDGRKVLHIKTGIYNLQLYVTDSSKYEILLPDYIAKEGSEEQNPFFIETELIPEVINNKQDLNNLIKAFDFQYNPVFNLVAERVFRNYKKEEIQQEISKLAKYSVVTADEFFNDYVRARMTMLNIVFYTAPADLARASGFINQSFDSDNQAFLELAEQMFSGYFNQLSTGLQKNSFSRAVAIASYPEMRSVIQLDGRISNKELSDFVTLLNLNECYYNHTLPGENVRKIISVMKSQASSAFMQDVASEVLEKMNSSLPGSIPTDFSLLNSEGKQMSLKDFRGKYLLLCFARSDNQASVMEMGIINMWQKKYVNDLTVVTILADKDFKTSSAILKNRGFNWTFLDGSKKEMIEYIYEIKMYPSFILLDREGKIIADPSPYPSENLEAAISKIVIGD
jgi:hypothetical protein